MDAELFNAENTARHQDMSLIIDAGGNKTLTEYNGPYPSARTGALWVLCEQGPVEAVVELGRMDHLDCENIGLIEIQ
jgi:hypothetical protein